MRTACNVIGFQCGWFACVLSAAASKPAIGLAITACILLAHLLWTRRSRAEVAMLAGAAAFGFAADSAAIAAGAVRFGSSESVAPAWMVALWANFAATLHVSMQWLAGRYVLAAILGAMAGPLSYWAGERLGAITLLNPAIIAVEWAIAMPVLLLIAEVTA